MKNIKFFAREKLFSSREKNEKTAREKKNRGREKFEKWAKKWAWKTKSAREKNQENSKNGFHGHFFFSREKKTLSQDTHEPTQLPVHIKCFRHFLKGGFTMMFLNTTFGSLNKDKP